MSVQIFSYISLHQNTESVSEIGDYIIEHRSEEKSSQGYSHNYKKDTIKFPREQLIHGISADQRKSHIYCRDKESAAHVYEKQLFMRSEVRYEYSHHRFIKIFFFCHSLLQNSHLSVIKPEDRIGLRALQSPANP